jgi:hypothetical protein
MFAVVVGVLKTTSTYMLRCVPDLCDKPMIRYGRFPPARAVFFGAVLSALVASSHDACAGSASFAGKVLDASSNSLSGAVITAGHFEGQFVVDGQAISNAQGQYAITTLGAGDGSGDYVLKAELAGRLTEFYPDPTCNDIGCGANGPPLVTVPNLNADFQLFRPGSISGYAARSDTNAPVCCVNIEFIRNDFFQPNYSARPDADGNYVVSGLLPGTYAVAISDFNMPDQLLQQVYAGHDFDSTMSAYADADKFTVGDGQDVQGIDFNLHPGASFSGVITSTLDGAPVATDVSVRRHSPFDTGLSYLFAARSVGRPDPEAGQYLSNAFVPGSFSVSFGRSDLFAPQYYPDVSAEANAQEVVLTGGNIVTGIDAQLTPTRTISGKVTDSASGLPLSGVTVHAGINFCVFSCSVQDEVDAVSDAYGNYILQGLGQTDSRYSYYIWVDDARGYQPQFFPDGTPCCFQISAGATPLPLGYNEYKTGIDLVLHVGAYASGRVYDPDTGYAPVGMRLDVLDSNGNTVQATYTDAAGKYWTPALLAGNYYLRLQIGQTLEYFYPNYECGFSDCQLSSAQQQSFPVLQEYPNLDFAIPHLDLIFRGSFGE